MSRPCANCPPARSRAYSNRPSNRISRRPCSAAGLRYAHQGGRNPPRIVVHGNQTDKLPAAYKRYLANRFRAAFKLVGVPLLLTFKTGDNPYKDKKNVLTARQIKKKRRLMSHAKR